MSDRKIPYTASDLREIADRIDEVTSHIGENDLADGDWRWGLAVSIFDDGDDRTGELRPHGDGWIGFYPIAVE